MRGVTERERRPSVYARRNAQNRPPPIYDASVRRGLTAGVAIRNKRNDLARLNFCHLEDEGRHREYR